MELGGSAFEVENAKSGWRWAGLRSALGSRAREMRDEGDEEGRRAREKKKLTDELRDEGGRRARETGELRDEGDERPVS